jgi:hypothetical protein
MDRFKSEPSLPHPWWAKQQHDLARTPPFSNGRQLACSAVEFQLQVTLRHQRRLQTNKFSSA